MNPSFARDLHWGRRIIEEHASGTGVNEMRILEDLQRYVSESRILPSTPREEVIIAWVGNMHTRARPLWPSTIYQRLLFVQKHEVDPFNVEASYRAWTERRLISAVATHKGRAGVKNMKQLITVELCIRISITRCPPFYTESNHMCWRCHFWFATVTGNRVGHFGDVKSIKLKDDHILVKWGPRKVQKSGPTDFLKYEFSWTCPPPADIAAYVEALENLPRLSTKTNRSSSMNSWLSRLELGVHVTSSCPRVMLSTILAEKVIAGNMHMEEFRFLLDHSIRTSLKYYHRHVEEVE